MLYCPLFNKMKAKTYFELRLLVIYIISETQFLQLYVAIEWILTSNKSKYFVFKKYEVEISIKYYNQYKNVLIMLWAMTPLKSPLAQQGTQDLWLVIIKARNDFIRSLLSMTSAKYWKQLMYGGLNVKKIIRVLSKHSILNQT